MRLALVLRCPETVEIKGIQLKITERSLTNILLAQSYSLLLQTQFFVQQYRDMFRDAASF